MSDTHTRDDRDEDGWRPGPSWRTAVVLAVVLLFVGLLAGMALGYRSALSQVRQANDEVAQARDDLKKVASVNEMLQERNWILYLESEKARRAEQTEPVDGEPGVYTDGTYQVGTDIEPGTYRGEVNGEFGYWARLSNTSGMVTGIIANNVVRGPFLLTIVPADVAVELRGVTIKAAE
jgi:hypothetical protein